MKPPKKPMGSAIRAQREQWQQSTPEAEAQQHEQSFLTNLSRAQTDFEWIVEHQAWKLLGHDSLAEWWGAKVQPVMSALSMRITPEMATKVIEQVKAAEAHLPASQRHSARDLAALVGTSDWTARGRQDRDKRRGADHPDLEKPAGDPYDKLPAEAKQAIEDRINQQTSGVVETSPLDDAGENTPADQPLPSDTAEDLDTSVRAESEEGRLEAGRPADNSPSEAGITGPAADGDGTPSAPADPEETVPRPSGSADPKPASKREETDEEEAARINREMRERLTERFCQSLVNLGDLPADPADWLRDVYLPGVYKLRDLPHARDCFTPSGIKQIAAALYALGDYMHETGQELL